MAEFCGMSIHLADCKGVAGLYGLLLVERGGFPSIIDD